MRKFGADRTANGKAGTHRIGRNRVKVRVQWYGLLFRLPGWYWKHVGGDNKVYGPHDTSQAALDDAHQRVGQLK